MASLFESSSFIWVWVYSRGVTLNIDQKNKKRQIIAHFILMYYENSNPWFCSKCPPTLAGTLWSRKLDDLLKGQIICWICSGFPAIFAAILLLNVGRMCNNENYIILMTFHEQKNCLLPFLALIKRNFRLIRLTKKRKYFWIFSLFKADSLSYQPLCMK